ncbi:MAG: ABC transporter substrate-binding protein [Alphaproteobacteria bacterium]
MRYKASHAAMIALAMAGTMCVAAASDAADLPKATQKILADLKLDPSVLDGLDRELAVPQAWIDGARKEGAVRLGSTFDPAQYRKLIQPFQERYPFIKIDYNRSSYQQRVTNVIIAYKQGHHTTDVVSSFGGGIALFREENALEDLRDLPGYQNLDAKSRSPDGFWVGYRLQNFCAAYNTKLVKASELPKKWTDILDNPAWRNGNLAVNNLPQVWLLPLWGANGEKYARDFATRLFQDVKPQVRKEGASALVALTVAGEFHMAFPTSDARTRQYLEKGAPIGFHCPEPVPTLVAGMGIVRGNPHPNASRILVNWFVSKEGQVAFYSGTYSPLAHKDLRRREFLPWPDQVIGKELAFRTPDLIVNEYPKLIPVWNALWRKSSGEGEEKTIGVKLESVNKGGREVVFMVSGKKESAGVSASRTKLTVGGKTARRTALKPGLSCNVTYRGSGSEATAIACK